MENDLSKLIVPLIGGIKKSYPDLFFCGEIIIAIICAFLCCYTFHLFVKMYLYYRQLDEMSGSLRSDFEKTRQSLKELCNDLKEYEKNLYEMQQTIFERERCILQLSAEILDLKKELIETKLIETPKIKVSYEPA